MKRLFATSGLLAWAAGFLLAGIMVVTSLAAAFTKDLTAGKITFHVTSTNIGSDNRVRVSASGPGIDPAPLTVAVNGPVTWAEVTDDLDNDGSPELYIYATCPEDGPITAGPDSHPDPALVVAVTPRGHGGRVTALVPVAPSGSDTTSGAVVVGPGMTRQTGHGTVRVFPVLPMDSSLDNELCINELKFILVKKKNGRILHLAHRKENE